MVLRMTSWRVVWALVLIVINVMSGTAWATTHLLPPPRELFPTAQLPGGLTFIAYREALRWAGGVTLALMVLLVLAHFAVYSYHHVLPTGRLVRRYTWREVFLHALLALAFVGAWASSTYLILARYVLGYHETRLGIPLGQASSTLHIVAGFTFLGALIALAARWWRSMRFAPYDPEWLRAVGGYFSRRHRILPAGRFNAGQKIWFRISIVPGVLVALSGVLIYYPGLFGLRAGIILYVAHTVLAVALSAAVIVHVYLAVLAHPRSARAMITGEIDEACLREDHPLVPLSGGAAGTDRT